MRLLSVSALILCAVGPLWAAETEVATESVDAMPEVKVPLHEHPTIVKMFETSNRLRSNNSRSPHAISPYLTQLAQKHAEWMARTGNFQHNYNHPYPEIIYYNARSIEQAFQGWMNSGPHRGIMMGGQPMAGYGYAISPSGATYWVGIFGNVPEKAPAEVNDET